MTLRPSDCVPHRAPILCIETIVSVDAEHAAAEARVGAPAQLDREGRCWEGALIEGLAQTAAVLNDHTDRAAGRRSAPGLLVGLRDLCIAERPRVGELVRFRVELVRRLPPLVLVEGVATVEGREVARGTLKFFVEEEQQSEQGAQRADRSSRASSALSAPLRSIFIAGEGAGSRQPPPETETETGTEPRGHE